MPLQQKTYTEEELDDLAAEDARGNSNEQTAAWLRSPEMRDRFYDALVRLSRSIDFQLSGKKVQLATKRVELVEGENPNLTAWHEFKARTGQWRVSTLRFKRAVEDRIAEVRALRRSSVPAEKVPLGGVQKILTAIQKHHESFFETVEEDEEHAADEKLWEVLQDPDVKSLQGLVKDHS